ncbi:hypothetical protein niasHT_037600 [Heterodera trifolii]|uniref:Uncharacterized protein n=1 Tax=Heterodera trifolii TaxID=157864 RepID=A0ABD2IC76_9BILA
MCAPQQQKPAEKRIPHVNKPNGHPSPPHSPPPHLIVHYSLFAFQTHVLSRTVRPPIAKRPPPPRCTQSGGQFVGRWTENGPPIKNCKGGQSSYGRRKRIGDRTAAGKKLEDNQHNGGRGGDDDKAHYSDTGGGGLGGRRWLLVSGFKWRRMNQNQQQMIHTLPSPSPPSPI